jgi:hypothetical protein
MRELSLNILDIIQNSAAAGATKIDVGVIVDTGANTLEIRVSDNGSGMSEQMVAKALDPFTTTRTTRKVGLGLPLLSQAAQISGGYMSIDSKPGAGTAVEAVFGLNNIDREPFGDITSTLITVVAAYPEIALTYRQSVDGSEFIFDSESLNKELIDVPINDPIVLKWLRDYIGEGLAKTGTIT